jgi:antitoxin component YwqK of YwqJK toxin-antitoxin module
MEGTLTTFYPNGQMRSVTTFINNQIQGPAKEFYENGNLKNESNFTGEPFKFTGQSASYYEGGELESEATYSDGKLIKAISYDKQGRITLEQSPANVLVATINTLRLKVFMKVIGSIPSAISLIYQMQ